MDLDWANEACQKQLSGFSNVIETPSTHSFAGQNVHKLSNSNHSGLQPTEASKLLIFSDNTEQQANISSKTLVFLAW